eukprot:Gregarina_sp_Pseudo_9__529@NODE_1341_length_1672_cov_4_298224_g1253_i0_p2_GENE_NODE_1341_length_1672_cov_4_298224_g1253_i0NODE_1341_length_1672_cov_4_298224_g1253_i0_p2_ORF_typecomplete_len152_score23_61HupH_C/PF04809_13/6_4e03HupH_C/PF04809_13/0_12_NODE_1341_length_1672_cov_4_298224_g1253_i018473
MSLAYLPTFCKTEEGSVLGATCKVGGVGNCNKALIKPFRRLLGEGSCGCSALALKISSTTGLSLGLGNGAAGEKTEPRVPRPPSQLAMGARGGARRSAVRTAEIWLTRSMRLSAGSVSAIHGSRKGGTSISATCLANTWRVSSSQASTSDK